MGNDQSSGFSESSFNSNSYGFNTNTFSNDNDWMSGKMDFESDTIITNDFKVLSLSKTMENGMATSVFSDTPDFSLSIPSNSSLFSPNRSNISSTSNIGNFSSGSSISSFSRTRDHTIGNISSISNKISSNMYSNSNSGGGIKINNCNSIAKKSNPITNISKSFPFTYDCEGSEGGKYHSRIIHHPTFTSGITIGRGYDLKERKVNNVINDLISCGISKENAQILSTACNKSKNSANIWKQNNQNFIKNFEITKEQQDKLFILTYNQMKNDMKRICYKDDIVKKIGKTDWNNLNNAIKDVIIDLRFRGDSKGTTRAHYHKYVVNNDVVGLLNNMKNRQLWKNVPHDRFIRRIRRLEKEVNRKK